MIARRSILITGFLVALLLPILPARAASNGQPPSLPAIVRQTMKTWFSANPGRSEAIQRLAGQYAADRRYRHPVGVFVTLSRNGQPRACWGSVHPEYPSAAQATVFATLGALTKEYRYRPIRPEEWPRLKPQVTVVKNLESVPSLSAINPLRDGLMLRAAGKSCVMLPGEARDAHYQMVQCRLKAGIRPDEPYQLYRIHADVYQ